MRARTLLRGVTRARLRRISRNFSGIIFFLKNNNSLRDVPNLELNGSGIHRMKSSFHYETRYDEESRNIINVWIECCCWLNVVRLFRSTVYEKIVPLAN